VDNLLSLTNESQFSKALLFFSSFYSFQFLLREDVDKSLLQELRMDYKPALSISNFWYKVILPDH